MDKICLFTESSSTIFTIFWTTTWNEELKRQKQLIPFNTWRSPSISSPRVSPLAWSPLGEDGTKVGRWHSGFRGHPLGWPWFWWAWCQKAIHGFGGCPGPILKDFIHIILEPASHAEPKAQWVRMRGLGDKMAISRQQRLQSKFWDHFLLFNF